MNPGARSVFPCCPPRSEGEELPRPERRTASSSYTFARSDRTDTDAQTALTSDQLTIAIDAAYRYRLVPDSALNLYLEVGDMDDVHGCVYNTYRSAARDAVANIAAADILSTERAGIGEQIQAIMPDG